MICHYWFFNDGFKFQDYISNGCHDLTMLIVDISNTAIIIVKSVDCRCIIHNISKSEGTDLLENSVLEGSFVFYFFCFAIYKMVDSEYSTNKHH